jgi:hypothetical protein
LVFKLELVFELELVFKLELVFEVELVFELELEQLFARLFGAREREGHGREEPWGRT